MKTDDLIKAMEQLKVQTGSAGLPLAAGTKITAVCMAARSCGKPSPSCTGWNASSSTFAGSATQPSSSCGKGQNWEWNGGTSHDRP